MRPIRPPLVVMFSNTVYSKQKKKAIVKLKTECDRGTVLLECDRGTVLLS